MTTTEEWTHTVVGGPWPERIGLRCRIVPNPGPGKTYPWDHDEAKYPRRNGAGAEAVILIENDPIRAAFEAEHPDQTRDDRWSCVLNLGALAEIRVCTTEGCGVSGPPDWMHVDDDGNEWCPDHCPDCADPRSETIT